MQKAIRPFLIAAFLGALVVSSLHGAPARAAVAKGKQEAMNLPVLTLQAWQTSPRNEKLSFLFGLTTMVELEKEWQGEAPLPISQSLNQSWVRALDGVSLGDICAAIDKFADEHPTLSQMSVLEAMGRMYVRPKLSEAERAEAAAKAKQIKESR